jgi:sugar/nucleoside kinase (ribokinase family)
MATSARATRPIDVLALGAAAVDDLLFVDAYPPPDSKCEIARHERRIGGLAAVALIAAVRMGARAAYAGCLCEEESARFVRLGLQAEGVSVGHIVPRAAALPFRSTIVVDLSTGSRTIMFDASSVYGADAELPAEEVIRSSAVLLVDHVGLAGMARAARIARAAGIPVVADFERAGRPPFDELFELSNHLILPAAFAKSLTGATSSEEAVRALWKQTREAVVVTEGELGSWYASLAEGGRVFHEEAFRVQTRDTTGCGDVFHGVYAAALAKGLPIQDRVRLASATAALTAARGRGASGIPRLAEVEDYIGAYGRQGQRYD